VFEWPKDGTLIVGGLKSNVKASRLLSGAVRTPRPTIPDAPSIAAMRPNINDFAITGLPSVSPDKTDTVIVLECEEPILTDPVRLLQPSFATETLRVFDGKLHGKGLKFGAGKTRDAYAYEWTRNDQFISWSTRLNQGASYEVDLIYDAEADSANGTFALSFGPETLKGTVKAGTMQTVSLGHVSLKAGAVEIKLSADEIKGSELMRPRCLVLKRI
jgi:hypothetical protein